jgi:hypothetical protein
MYRERKITVSKKGRQRPSSSSSSLVVFCCYGRRLNERIGNDTTSRGARAHADVVFISI